MSTSCIFFNIMEKIIDFKVNDIGIYSYNNNNNNNTILFDKNSTYSTLHLLFDPVVLIFNQYYNSRGVSKFIFLKNSIENIFNTKEHKTKILDIFCKLQRTYHALSRLSYIYKYKKTKTTTTTDMYMNDFSPCQKNVICIYQNGSKHSFSTTDLVKIINNALFNSPYFFAEPLSIKNPWNNVPFTKANLYNIYFFIKNYNSVVPILFHNYFLTNFNLTKFKKNNEFLIRNYSINSYIANSSTSELYSSIIQMIYENNYRNKLRVHSRFPRDKLVEIFRPYLLLFYKSKYAFGEMCKQKYYIVLKNKMKNFIQYNPKFGRRRVDMFQNEHFNECYIEFNCSNSKRKNAIEFFKVSHINLEDSDNEDIDSTDYMEEEDSED